MGLSEQIKKIGIALFIGLLIGLTVALFFKSLFWIQNFHDINQNTVFLLPVVWLILRYTKRMTLYFPVSVAEVYNAQEMNYRHWNKLSVGFNFLGSLMSHFSGASVGREGVAVTMSASFAQIFKLNWLFWRPIVVSAGFSVAVANPFVGIVFMYELFNTRIDQKILVLVMSWVACLVLQTFQLPHLLEPFLVLGANAYMQKLFFVISAAVVIGFLSRLYKSLFFKLKAKFDRSSVWFLLLLVVSASLLLVLPQYKDLQSLSLSQFKMVQMGEIGFEFIGLKLLATVFFVSIGFWGGEFVPSVLIGSATGIILAKYLNMDPMFGLMIGSFAFFCGITRLKWTALVLTGLLVGMHQLVWVYVALTICRWFSGATSVYTTEPHRL